MKTLLAIPLLAMSVAHAQMAKEDYYATAISDLLDATYYALGCPPRQTACIHHRVKETGVVDRLYAAERYTPCPASRQYGCAAHLLGHYMIRLHVMTEEQ